MFICTTAIKERQKVRVLQRYKELWFYDVLVTWNNNGVIVCWAVPLFLQLTNFSAASGSLPYLESYRPVNKVLHTVTCCAEPKWTKSFTLTCSNVLCSLLSVLPRAASASQRSSGAERTEAWILLYSASRGVSPYFFTVWRRLWMMLSVRDKIQNIVYHVCTWTQWFKFEMHKCVQLIPSGKKKQMSHMLNVYPQAILLQELWLYHKHVPNLLHKKCIIQVLSQRVFECMTWGLQP